MKTEVHGRRNQKRQKKRWRDMIQKDFNSLHLKRNDTEDKVKWRKRIRTDDPFPVKN